MSDYLDNMDVPEGHMLECKSNLCCPHITVGDVYTVTYRDEIAGVINDEGDWVIPSARFTWAFKRPRVTKGTSYA